MIRKINKISIMIFIIIGFLSFSQYSHSIYINENNAIIQLNGVLNKNYEHINFDITNNNEIIFADNMELNEDSWSHSDLSIIYRGHWIIKDSGYDSYLWCGINNAITLYDNNWNDVALINLTFDFSLFSNIYINFDTYYRIDLNDYGFVEISRDGGRHWDIITVYDGNLNWTSYSYNISSFKNRDNVLIRFRFLSNESYNNEGWFIDDIIVKGDNETIFYDDFEYENNKWIIEKLRPGDWWQRIRKTKNNNQNNIAWWCGDEYISSYPSNLNNGLFIINEIDLSQFFDVDVFFSTIYNISNNDRGYFEIKSDDESSWEIIDTFFGDSKVDNEINWINKSYELDQYIGKIIFIRFRFISDSSSESKGWYIDDFKILGNFDNDPPETTSVLTGDIGQDDWYLSQVELLLKSNDGDGCGVDAIYYRLNDGNKKTYSTPLIINENGWYTIEYWSIDKLGNIENHNYKKFKIDMNNPNISIIQPEIGMYLVGNKIWPIFRDEFFTISKPVIIGNIEIKVDASDNTSGINRVEFYLDNDLNLIDYDIPYCWIWLEHNLKIRYNIKTIVYDDAGNNAIKEVSVWRFF